MLTSNLLAVNTLASMCLETQNQSFPKKPLRICEGIDTSYGEGSGTPLQYSVWKIPWTEEPGRLRSMGSLRVGHDFTFTFTFHFPALEKEMATHSSVLSWRLPGTEEPVGLPFMGSHRVGHD